MGFAQAGTSHHDGDDLAIAGAKPNGMAAQGNVIWRSGPPTWNILGSANNWYQQAISDIVTAGPIDTTGANLLVMMNNGWTNQTVFSDSMNNTWLAGNMFYDSVIAGSAMMVYCINPVTSTAHTFSTTNYNNVIVYAIKLDGGTPVFDQTGSTGSTSGTVIQLSPLTPTKNNSLVISTATHGSLVSDPYVAQIDSGFTIRETFYANANIWGGAGAWLVQAVAATLAPTWTFPEAYAVVSMMNFIPG